MLGDYFYHESLRKIIIAFGTIFNNIHIHRKDSNGNLVQSFKVPFAYSPKEKFIARLDQQPNLVEDRRVAVTLPRMGFEISGLNYDPSRKLNRMGQIKKVRSSSTDGKVMNKQFNPVPYNISTNLYSFTSSAEGGLQIVEQILPFFQPDYTVTIRAIPNMDIVRDVPIILNSVSYEDTYSGDFTTRRAVVYTLNFTAKTYLYGPISQQKVIKSTQTDMFTDTDTTSKREQRIVITPNPTSADADDDFGFTTTITSFTDSKNYNPTSDSDE